MENNQILELMQPLKAADVEVRVGNVNKNGANLLLYKTARVDTRRLNEVFGTNWQCNYERDGENLVCTISVYDKELQQWVKRCNVGTKSYTEEIKGEYSDALKRAGTTWGIGLELYNAPDLFMFCPTKPEKNRYKIADYANTKLSISKYRYSQECGFEYIQIANKDGLDVVNYTMDYNKDHLQQTVNSIKDISKLKGYFNDMITMHKRCKREIADICYSRREELKKEEANNNPISASIFNKSNAVKEFAKLNTEEEVQASLTAGICKYPDNKEDLQEIADSRLHDIEHALDLVAAAADLQDTGDK